MTPPIDPGLVARVDAAVRQRNPVQKKDETFFTCPNSAGHRNGDQHPSCRWNLSKGTFYCDPCGKGGGAVELARLLGVELKPRAPGKAASRPSLKVKTTTYTIRDVDGQVVAEHRRHDPLDGGKKSFTWWRDGRKGLGGLSAEDVSLYRSEDLKALPDGSTVVVAEGEKATDALRSHGIPSVGTVTGAGSAPSTETLKCLARLDVVLWPDADIGGFKHMRLIAHRLKEAGGPDARVVRWSAAPPKGDAHDYFARGGTAEDARCLLAAASPFAPEAAASGKPEIHVRNQLTAVADEAEAALLASPNIEIYVRARMLVRILRTGLRKREGLNRPPLQPVIVPFSSAGLRERLDRAAKWTKWNASANAYLPALPPEWAVETLMEQGEWGFPHLEAVIEYPTLRPDGSLLDTPGYDPATGLLFEPNRAFPAIPPSPTLTECQAAVEVLIEPFCGFPFVTPTSRAAVLAAILTGIARPAIDGPTPLFAARAPGPGTGKTLLIDSICNLIHGRGPSLMTHAADQDEMRKRILSIAIEGLPCVLIDNLDGVVGSSVLAAALTAREWTDRYLGLSKTVTAPLRTVWFITGNNLRFGSTLGRRVVPIDMDAKCEHPEDRTGFRHPLPDFVQTERPALVAAALTILRGFTVAGRPGHGKPLMGSFEAWDRLVRSCCIWVGAGDPAAAEDPGSGRGAIREESDEDLEVIGTLLAALRNAFQAEVFTAGEAVKKAESTPTLHDALVGAASAKKGGYDGRSVGNAFKACRGRIVGGLCLDLAGTAGGGVKTWSVAAGVGRSESLSTLRGVIPDAALPDVAAGSPRPESDSPRPTPAVATPSLPLDPLAPAAPPHAEDCDCGLCIPMDGTP